MNTQLLKSLAIAALVAVPALTLADDTDIYIANDLSQANASPMVMFSVDYRSNLTSSGGSADYFVNYCVSTGPVGAPMPPSTTPVPCGDAAAYQPVRTAAALVQNNFKLFDMLRLSLQVVLIKHRNDGIRIGLMFNHNNDNNCAGPSATNCSNGGTMLMGFQTLSDTNNYAALDTFLGKFNHLKTLKPLSNSPDHPYQGSELFFEFFRYLTGQGIYNGHNGRTDYEGSGGVSVNTSTNSNPGGPYDPASWDPAIESGTNYISPFANATACTKLYTINFLFSVSNADGDSAAAQFRTSASQTVAQAKAQGRVPILDPGANNDGRFKGILNYLYSGDLSDGTLGTAGSLAGAQSVTSYFFTSQINTSTNDYAAAGGSSSAYALSGDPATLTADLDRLLRQILSVSTTFVATAVPANVFNRAQFIDNAYVALFQPSNNGTPAWTGNLKKLRIATLNNVTTFVDATHPTVPAVSNLDGRIDAGALTFWSDNTNVTAGNPPGNLKNAATGDSSDGPPPSDGRQVNRGGAGQKIPGWISGSPELTNTSSTTARKVYYDNNSANLVALNADSSTSNDPFIQAALNKCGATATSCVGDSAGTLVLLKYMRGLDPTSTATPPAPRSWIMGDPLHSRPLPINYGAATIGGSTYTTANPAIFIAMAGNDGALHLIRNTNAGGSSSTDLAVQSGKEEWAFIPRAAMSIQNTLRLNAIPVSPNKPFHSYGLDGTAVLYTYDANSNGTIESGDKVYLFIGMRRGGKTLYGLDITNPLAPTLRWKIDDTTNGFDQLNYTFSTPKVGCAPIAPVSGEPSCHGGTGTPALYFAGGYNTLNDYDKTTPTNAASTGDDSVGTDCKGCSIYVVKAHTGALIWKAHYGSSTGPVGTNTFTHQLLVDSIASDVTIVDSQGNGTTDRVVVGDTGGNLWRADVGSSNTALWRLTLLAKLGRHGVVSPTKADDRRFFSAPDFVQTKDSSGVNADAVLLGSGDREDPLDKAAPSVAGSNPPTTNKTANFFFNILDHHTATLVAGDGVGGATYDLSSEHAALADLTSDCFGIAGCDTSGINLTQGWKIALNAARGEKALSSALTFANVIYFNTYVPPEADLVQQSAQLTCGPPEGDGLTYAISLQNAIGIYGACGQTGQVSCADCGHTGQPACPVAYNPSPYIAITGDENTIQRADRLASGGIPAQMVFLPGSTPRAIRPDLKIPDIAGKIRYTTFWQRVEDVP